LRKDTTTASIPIIMLTGLVGRLSRMNGYLHGASAYLTKPFLPDELIDKINELMTSSSPKASKQY
jgi:twitching motility two-component system response regulator PilG